MIRLLLAVFGPRFFTAKSKQLLIIGSFYTLISDKSEECRKQTDELNTELQLAKDPRGLLLGTILPEILWDKETCSKIRAMPAERLVPYYETMIPKWLKEGAQDCSFNLQSELQRVVQLRSPAA